MPVEFHAKMWKFKRKRVVFVEEYAEKNRARKD